VTSVLPQKVFVSSRAKTSMLFLISLAFVAIALLLPEASPGSYGWRVGAVIFFGLGMLVFGGLMLRPQQLILDSDGFTLVGGLALSPKTIRWREIDRFFTFRLPHGRKMIGFNYRPGSRDPSALLKFNRATARADGALSGLWRVEPEKIVDELNDYRQRAG
jgi:hypothetical protein